MKKMKVIEKQISKAQKGMRVLGILHYVLAVFLLVIIIMILIVGPERLGAAIHERHNASLSALNRVDDRTAGITAIVLLVIQFGIEVFLGWSTRRRSRRPDRMLTKLLLSGGSIVITLYSLIRTGFAGTEWISSLYTLALHTATFLLALWIKRGYDRQRQKPVKPA